VKWNKIDGSLKNICQTDNGEHVWGVNSSHDIFYRHGRYGSWKHIDGKLTQIAVGGMMGLHVWGVQENDNIFYREGENSKWK
jgi:hypothetical protein